MSAAANKTTIEAHDLEAIIAQLHRSTTENEQLKQQLREAQATIEHLLQRSFGRSSEKRDIDGQGLLFEEGTVDAPAEQAEEDDPAPRKRRRRKPRPNPEGFPPDLPRNEIREDPPEAERTCRCCSNPLTRMGEDVTERLSTMPRRFVVNRYVRGRWACSCKEGGVIQAPAPTGIVDRSRYEASVYALVVASKYLLHLPLYRLEAEFRSQGISLPRSTMWNLCERTAELMKPVADQIEREILARPYLQLDDSFVTVVSPGKKGSSKAHIWVVRHGKRAFYRITRSRNREVPKELLAGWEGWLFQGDGHDCMNGLATDPRRVRVGCWAHARRLFIKAESEDSATSAWFIARIRRIFLIERRLKRARDERGLDDAAFERLRFEARRRLTRRVLQRIETKRYELIHSDLPPLPKSRIGKALSYLSSQYEPLHAVLTSGCLEIDNNASERDLRHGVIGRKNWQMTSEEKGAETMATIFTLAVGCKALGVHFESYLTDVLPRLAEVRASEVASLTPWAWGRARGLSASTD